MADDNQVSVTRFILKGTPGRSIAYTRQGQVLLDDLLKRMKFQNLQQLMSRTILPDGTEIVCQSVFGHNQVTITSVLSPSKKKPQKPDLMLGRDVFIILYYAQTYYGCFLYQFLFDPITLKLTSNDADYWNFPSTAFGPANEYWPYNGVYLPVRMYSCANGFGRIMWRYLRYPGRGRYPHTHGSVDGDQGGPQFKDYLFLSRTHRALGSSIQLSGDVNFDGWITGTVETGADEWQSSSTPFMYSVARSTSPAGYRFKHAWVQRKSNWSAPYFHWYNYLFTDWILKDDGTYIILDRQRKEWFSEFAPILATAFGERSIASITGSGFTTIEGEGWAGDQWWPVHVERPAWVAGGGVFYIPHYGARSVLDTDGVWKSAYREDMVDYSSYEEI